MVQDTKNTLSFNDIEMHINQLEEQLSPVDHREVVEKLLEKIQTVNFFKATGKATDGEEKVTEKEYQILVVEEILTLAKQHRWGLCKRHDFIYIYNGAFWKLFDESDFKSFLSQAAEKMGVPEFKVKHFTFRDALFKQFEATANLPTPHIDKNVVTINLLNGTFKVTPTGTLIDPFNRNDFITYQLPFEYDPEAITPRFYTYLTKVLPDEDSRKVLAEFIGYIFIKNLKLEKALLLYGSGANGKSVFFEIINAMLGKENTSTYSLQSLTNDNGYYRGSIANKLVNYASEINGKLESSKFKQLVSGEPIEARLPYGKPFIIEDYAKLIFNCNELPRDVEHTNAFFRRVLIIPFDVTIPENAQDKELASKIIDTELPGVFNWALDGLRRLLQNKKFSNSEKSSKALDTYRKEADSVAMFIEDENYISSPELENEEAKPTKDLYKEYRQYCLDDGFKPASHKTFNNRLRALGFDLKKTKTGQKAWVQKNKCF